MFCAVGFPAVYPANKTVYFTPGEDLTLNLSAAQYMSLHWLFIGPTLEVGGTRNTLDAGEYSLEDFNQTVVVHNATARHEGYYVAIASSSQEVDLACVTGSPLDTCAGRVAVLQALARSKLLSWNFLFSFSLPPSSSVHHGHLPSLSHCHNSPLLHCGEHRIPHCLPHCPCCR